MSKKTKFFMQKQGYIPFVFEVAARRPGRPTDDRRHTMKASTRSQQRGGFKGERYKCIF
ncbi:hypothetical protein [Candidatus Regiella endosymbiont of Tuberolachnus salignus]|uniref:hypothetical protein n=1 Tax=Candidatus Regiella endosymbiont of Tuberolachnus salignus TaxID=3077956 RepID=UPI0030CB281E